MSAVDTVRAFHEAFERRDFGHLRLTEPTEANVRMCELFVVEGGRVQSAEAFYDSRQLPVPG